MSKPRKAQLPKVIQAGSVEDRPELGERQAGSVGDSTPRRFGRRPELRGRQAGSVGDRPELGGRQAGSVGDRPELGGRQADSVGDRPELGGRQAGSVGDRPELELDRPEPGLGQRPAGAGGAGNDTEAASTAERVRRLVGEGAGLLAAKRPGEAIPKLQEALSLDPDNVSAAINLGGAFILQGKHALAVPALETASRLEPDNAMVWSNLAAAHLGKLPFSTQTHQDRAIAAYERALALDPRAPNVHYNLGLIYLERNEMARAAAHFYSALETDPNDRDAQLWLDRTQSGRGPADQAGPDNPRDG